MESRQDDGNGLRERLAGLRRYTTSAIVTGVAVLLGLAIAVVAWPPTYRSTATILIEQQEIPAEFIRSMISSYADQRVQLVKQRVMTSETLLSVIDKHGLYPEWRDDKPREMLVERMRDDIRMEMISADVVDPRLGRPVKATIAFSIGFDSRSPLTAVRVANELTTLYLNENLRSRAKQVQDTEGFLKDEADRLATEVAALESALADFKSRNLDRLPELASLNLSLMTRTEDELRQLDTRLQSLDERDVYLDAQLAQVSPTANVMSDSGERILSSADRLRALRSQFVQLSARYSARHPDVLRLEREIEGLEREVGRVDDSQDLVRQLASAKSQLETARENYLPDHPDVRQMEAVVAGIEQALLADRGSAASIRAMEQPDNPAYIQLQSQKESVAIERRAILQQRSDLQAKLVDLERRVARTPAVERDYTGIVRDLEGARFKYQQVRQKQLEAQLSENLELQRMGERFTLIEPPLQPEDPVSPNRPLLLTFSFLLAIAAGIGTAFLRDAVDPSVRGRADLARLLDVEPLAVVPWIATRQELDTRRRRLKWAVASGAAGLVSCIVAVHVLWRPLDVVWVVAMRRLGL